LPSYFAVSPHQQHNKAIQSSSSIPIVKTI
jgi:hypothetical protein